MTGIERRRWVIVGALFVNLTIMFGGGILTFGVFFNPLRTHFSWSYEQTSSLLTILLLTITVTAPAVGWLLDRVEARWAIIAGAILMAAGDVIASRSHAYEPMAIAYVISGAGLALSTLVAAQVVIAHWFEERMRGAAFGIAAAGTAAGGFTMVLLAAGTLAHWGWRGAFLAMAAPIVVIVIPLTALVIRGRPPVAISHSAIHSELPGLDISQGVRTGAFWLIMLGYLCYGFAVGMPVAYIIPFFIKIGNAPHAAAMLVVYYEIIATAGSLMMGVFGDKLGGKVSVAFCFVIMGISLIALLGGRAISMKILFIVLFGLAVASPTALLALLLAQTMGLRSFGFFSGAGQFLLNLGFAVSPFVGGYLIDTTHAYRDAFGLCAIVALIAAAVCLAVYVPKTGNVNSTEIKISNMSA
ncbi:MAG: MFS transporter [Candidatus Binataceae bacterium]